MPLILSDETLSSIKMTAEEVRLNLGIWLFLEQRISIGKAAQLAGMNRFEFQKVLSARQIPTINYEIKDVEKELNALSTL
jgi:predicted HTH domain antitoxin